MLMPQTPKFQRRFRPEDAPRRRRFGLILGLSGLLVAGLIYALWPSAERTDWLELRYLNAEQMQVEQDTLSHELWLGQLLERARARPQARIRLCLPPDLPLSELEEVLRILRALDRPWHLRSDCQAMPSTNHENH